MHSNTYRTLSGIEVSNDNLAFDAINEAVLGVGHTIAAMERDYFYTSLADRLESRTLAENGAKDAWTVARERVRDVLANYHPDYLSSDQDAAIRRRFDIL